MKKELKEKSKPDWEKEFDKIYYYQKVKKPDGRYIFVCQNSYLIDKIRQLLVQERKKMEELNPYKDWRIITNQVKNYPSCKNCGKVYGNVAFGAEHWCEKGYKPIENNIKKEENKNK